MDKENEQVRISLNFRGKDVCIETDCDTAELLLNDPDAATQYLDHIFNTDNGNKRSDDEASCSQSRDVVAVWQSKGKPTQADEEATDLFLNLRLKYSKKFDDKKTHKSQLWQLIAREMKEEGYFVGDGKEGGEKCRQKFCNMQKQYMTHVVHMKKTGTEKKDEPPHFQQLHDILGHKHKSDPQNLQDSEDIESDGDHKEGQTDTNKDEIKNRFKKKTLKPNSPLVSLLEKQHSENREDRKEMTLLLKEQNEQRKQMLQLMQTMIKGKRKRSSSESS